MDQFRYRRPFGRRVLKREQEEQLLKRGGYVGGLVNDGNTCFMNSVIQSLASSQELNSFLDNVLETKDNAKFTAEFKNLLNDLNAKHGNNKPYFKPNKMLKTMSKTPNKNLLLGYDQEDAQEFFQTILNEVENDVKEKEELKASAFKEDNELPSIGKVYIPTKQIDPNSVEEDFYTPFKLVTPLDGLTAERIGCLSCGENGGIRYSVFSGLSLNLPNDNYAAVKLSDLLNEWIKPEIIEGVDCYRCALQAVLDFQKEHLESFKEKNASEKLLEATEKRIAELEQVLNKPVIDEEDYKRLHTKNMVRKCSKSKQILMSRPPPLLSVHINRSVFDPRTYYIRKNNARVMFKSRMSLEPWVASFDDINLDARLPMSKKDITIEESSDEEVPQEYAELHKRHMMEFEDSDEEEESDDNVREYDPLEGESESSEDASEYEEEVDALGNTIRRVKLSGGAESPESESEEMTEEEEQEEEEEEEEEEDVDEDDEEDIQHHHPDPSPLTYVLRSAIVHYGSHNYGHYIAFRRYRGVWWRISDENVYVVPEAEVLSTPGVFMLFYEYDYDAATGTMKDDAPFPEDCEQPVLIVGEENDEKLVETDGASTAFIAAT